MLEKTVTKSGKPVKIAIPDVYVVSVGEQPNAIEAARAGQKATENESLNYRVLFVKYVNATPVGDGTKAKTTVLVLTSRDDIEAFQVLSEKPGMAPFAPDARSGDAVR